MRLDYSLISIAYLAMLCRDNCIDKVFVILLRGAFF